MHLFKFIFESSHSCYSLNNILRDLWLLRCAQQIYAPTRLHPTLKSLKSSNLHRAPHEQFRPQNVHVWSQSLQSGWRNWNEFLFLYVTVVYCLLPSTGLAQAKKREKTFYAATAPRPIIWRENRLIFPPRLLKIPTFPSHFSVFSLVHLSGWRCGPLSPLSLTPQPYNTFLVHYFISFNLFKEPRMSLRCVREFGRKKCEGSISRWKILFYIKRRISRHARAVAGGMGRGGGKGVAMGFLGNFFIISVRTHWRPGLETEIIKKNLIVIKMIFIFIFTEFSNFSFNPRGFYSTRRFLSPSTSSRLNFPLFLLRIDFSRVFFFSCFSFDVLSEEGEKLLWADEHCSFFSLFHNKSGEWGQKSEHSIGTQNTIRWMVKWIW